MKALRIALVGPAYPLRGGIAHHTTELSRALAQRGHSVLFLSLKRQYPGFLFPGTTQFDSSRAPLQCPNEPVLDPMLPWTWLVLARKIIAFKPELAVLVWWNPILAPAYWTVARALKRSDIPVCLLAHNVEPHERSALGDWLFRITFDQVDRFLSITGQSDHLDLWNSAQDRVQSFANDRLIITN